MWSSVGCHFVDMQTSILYMKGIRGLLCSTSMSEQQEEQAMDVNPPPDPNVLQVGEAVTSGEGAKGGEPPKSPTKNFRYFWVEKVDNSYAKPTRTARSISQADIELGVGVPKKRENRSTTPHKVSTFAII